MLGIRLIDSGAGWSVTGKAERLVCRLRGDRIGFGRCDQVVSRCSGRGPLPGLDRESGRDHGQRDQQDRRQRAEPPVRAGGSRRSRSMESRRPARGAPRLPAERWARSSARCYSARLLGLPVARVDRERGRVVELPSRAHRHVDRPLGLPGKVKCAELVAAGLTGTDRHRIARRGWACPVAGSRYEVATITRWISPSDRLHPSRTR